MIAFNAIHAKITWTLSDDGTLTISGTGDMEDYSRFDAPWLSQRDKIKKVVIENGVTNIGSYAFREYKSLTSITIPNSVTSIGEYAFSDCSSLTSMTIPNSVTSIGEYAFFKCSGLISITIPNSVTSIEWGTFSNCSALASVNIPNSVRSIGIDAFFACSTLTSVTIPNSVTIIGSRVFSGCSNLSSINIPESVTTIGSDAFDGTKWYEKQPDGLVYAGLFLYKYKGTMPANTKIVVKEGTKWISVYAFRGCSGLTSITFANSVTSINSGAFENCSSLTSITIPNSVTSINSGAFRGCSSLASVTIPNSVTSIGDYVFYNCVALVSITIPESVTNIGESAFEGAKLRNIVIKAKTPPSGNSAFSDQTYYHTTLMIPEGCWDAYAYSDDIWYKFINIREMVDNTVNLTNSKAYTMKSTTEGAYLFYDSVNDCVGTLNETAFDDTEENNTWMTVEVDGKNYVYNLGAKKFLVPDKTNKTGYSLSDTPVSIDIEDGKDAIVFGKGKEFYMVINDKLNVDEGLESQIIATTGIKGVSVEANKQTVNYNVNGQIVPDNIKGLHIRNGKKVVVK